MPWISGDRRTQVLRVARTVAEGLERRALLATFQFFGDNAVDNISVEKSGANINISIDGVGSNVPDLASTRIEIFSQGSADRINIASNGVSTVVVDGGFGDDIISLAFVTSSANLDGINGPVQLAGGFDNDLLAFGDETHNAASGNVLYSLTSTFFERSSVSDTTASITHSGFERIALVTTDNEPTQTFLANGFIPTEVLAGPFADELILGATTNRLALDNRGLVTFSGAWQLIPALRRRWPAMHRWNGRLFLGVALLTTFSGFYLTWVRGSQLGPASNLSTGTLAAV